MGTIHTDDRRRDCLTRGLIACFAMALSAGLPATANAEFEAAVRAGVIFADNIYLSRTDPASETVYTLAPSFRYKRDSTRLDADIHYLAEGFHYSGIGESEIYHQFDGKVDLALVPDKLSLRLTGRRDQSIRDTSSSVPADNLPISSNRMNRSEYTFGPVFDLDVGRSTTISGNYRVSKLSYDEPRYDIIDGQGSGDLNVNNYRGGKGFTWGLRYLWRRTVYKNDLDPWEYQQATVEVGYWVSDTTRVFVSGGRESDWEEPLDPAMTSPFWEGGIAKSIGDSFYLELAGGERTFGSSFRGTLRYKFRTGSTSVEYVETPTNEGRNPFNPGAFGTENDPYNYLARPGSGNRFILKRFQWNATLESARTEVTLLAYWSRQTDITQSDGTPVPGLAPDAVLEQLGMSLGFIRDLNPRLRFDLRGYWTRSDSYDNSSKNEYLRGAAGLAYQLGRRTAVSLVYDYIDNKNDKAGAVANNYRYNSIGLYLNRRF